MGAFTYFMYQASTEEAGDPSRVQSQALATTQGHDQILSLFAGCMNVVLENMKLYDFKDVPTGIKAHIRTTLAERRMAKDAHRRGHFYVSSTSSSSASASSFRTPKLKEVVRVNGTWVHPQPPPPAMFTPWPGPVP